MIRGNRGSSRVFVALLAMVLLGLPLAVAGHLLRPKTVTNGAQPGGTLRGVVLDRDGRAIPDAVVELFLVEEEGERASQAKTRTGREGTFEFRAPAHKGHYEIRSGGGEFQRVVEAVSFFDGRGRVTADRETALVLHPGCIVEVLLERKEGPPVEGGTLLLEGRVEPGFLFGLLRSRLRLEREFTGRKLELDGLPALDAKLRIELSSGESIEFEMRIGPGRTTRTFQL